MCSTGIIILTCTTDRFRRSQRHRLAVHAATTYHLQYMYKFGEEACVESIGLKSHKKVEPFA